MLKRKITKVTKEVRKFLKSGKNTTKSLLCKECDKNEVVVPFDVVAVTCSHCVQRQVAPPAGIKPKPESEKFPRGWALKQRYVHTDGRVFIKGKETGEVDTPKTSKPKKEKKSVSKKKVSKKSPKRRK